MKRAERAAHVRDPQVPGIDSSVRVVTVSRFVLMLMQVTPKDIVEFVNQEVFNQLIAKSRDALTKVVEPKMVMNVLNEARAKKSMDNGFVELKTILDVGICGFYGGCSVSDAVVEEVVNLVTNKTMAKFGGSTPPPSKLKKEDIKQLEIAFTETEYVGDAQVQFEEYLWRCWEDYNPAKYKAPYVAVVQSSGFGKSRMLFELARKAERAGSQMKVLYTCVRLHKSSGFPEATKKIRDCADWDNVQTEWIDLFTKTSADIAVAGKLIKALENVSEHKEVQPSDERASAIKDPKGKMVVLVIDEARALLDLENGGVNYFHLLRQALVSVNFHVGSEGGIFGVLVDTNSQVSDLTSPASSDPSSRNFEGGEFASFPPFVLTQTMDVNWRKYCEDANGDGEVEGEIAMYKSAVITSKTSAWEALTRMGRPMWKSTFTELAENRGLKPTTQADVINLAANKLLLGRPPGTDTYDANTMFGVASMLCRIGVRPYSTSTLASKSVANFMAILAYVNHEKHLSSYASDPVLTLGAIKVWYALDAALPTYILPQLKKLMLDEVLDTGGTDAVVSRILMLLAMDKCAMGGMPFADCQITGQFVSVLAFLKVLGGDEMPIYREGMIRADDEKPVLRSELEPNEDTLWYLLGRRAAGIFPRNQNEADLLIPIFWKRSADTSEMETDRPMAEVVKGEEKVSLILIQVKSRYPSDCGFAMSATTKMHPSFVFGEKKRGADQKPSTHKFVESKMLVDEVIRIYMNVRDEGNEPCRFIYSQRLEDTSRVNDGIGTETSSKEGDATKSGGKSKRGKSKLNPRPSAAVFTMCFRSLSCAVFPFLEGKVAERLASIAASVWDPMRW